MSDPFLYVAVLGLLRPAWFWSGRIWLAIIPDSKASCLVLEDRIPQLSVCRQRKDDPGQCCSLICSHSRFCFGGCLWISKEGCRDTGKFLCFNLEKTGVNQYSGRGRAAGLITVREAGFDFEGEFGTICSILLFSKI